MSINKVILIGNVGKDPDIHKTEKTTIASFTLATSENWKDKQGEKQSKTEWHNIVIFGKLAEIVEKYVKKGNKIYLEGKIQTEKYTKDGQDKYVTKINCHNMQMLGGKSTEKKEEEPNYKPQITPLDHDDDSDDLPF